MDGGDAEESGGGGIAGAILWFFGLTSVAAFVIGFVVTAVLGGIAHVVGALGLEDVPVLREIRLYYLVFAAAILVILAAAAVLAWLGVEGVWPIGGWSFGAAGVICAILLVTWLTQPSEPEPETGRWSVGKFWSGGDE